MKLKITELTELMRSALTKKYYSEDEANRIIEVFLYAELTGKNTQGILKLLGTEPAQEIKPQYAPKVIKETEVSAVIDGGGAAGPLPAQIATDKVIEIAYKKGIGIVALNNIFSSIGAIGFYTHKIAKKNFIGIVCANSPRGLAYHKGIEPLFGTNPISYGFPTTSEPVVTDMASSAITWYGLVRAKALGEKIPENVAIDSYGNATTDPQEAMEGAILPFDRGHKGFGLALTVELLAGALTGASFVFDEGAWGATFIAINPELLIGSQNFKENASALVDKVRKSKTKDGNPVHIPGMDNYREMEKKLHEGDIEIADTLIEQLKEITRKDV